MVILREEIQIKNEYLNIKTKIIKKNLTIYLKALIINDI